MKKHLLALVAVVCSSTAFGQQIDLRQQQQRESAVVRSRAIDEQARANALLTALLETYRQLLERETGMTPEERRQLANTIDDARLSIPKMAEAVREVYARFRGDRVLIGASFGIGGEVTFFRNARVPLVNRVPGLNNLSTGADASVGIAGVLIRNDVDGGFFPQFSGYYSVGLQESNTNRSGLPAARAAKAPARATLGSQGFTVWRVYLVPRNVLSEIKLADGTKPIEQTPAHIGALSGTYLGGGGEMGWRFMRGGEQALQTQVFGRWSIMGDLNSQNNAKELIQRLSPEVVMLSLAPMVGFKGPRFSALAGAQYVDFFGIERY